MGDNGKKSHTLDLSKLIGTFTELFFNTMKFKNMKIIKGSRKIYFMK